MMCKGNMLYKAFLLPMEGEMCTVHFPCSTLCQTLRGVRDQGSDHVPTIAGHPPQPQEPSDAHRRAVFPPHLSIQEYYWQHANVIWYLCIKEKEVPCSLANTGLTRV